MADQALSHLRVLDLTRYIAGPYCTKMMAGFGAEVIKIERPITGDELRNIGPFCSDEPGLERSIPFLWLNTGKKRGIQECTETGALLHRILCTEKWFRPGLVVCFKPRAWRGDRKRAPWGSDVPF